MRRTSYILLAAMLFLQWGCNGLDDDSEYESRTRAAFFLSDQASSGLNSVHKYTSGGLEWAWNERFGVADGNVGDLFSAQSTIWLSQASPGRLMEIDPENDGVLQEIAFPHRVHHFAVGERHVLGIDTVDDRYSYYNRRKEEFVTLDLPGEAGPAIYNNSRFYFQTSPTSISAIDEYALVARTTAQLQHPLHDFQFNKVKNIPVQTRDSSDKYFVLMSGVDDRLVSTEAKVLYEKVRYSPYLEARFGSEWTEDVRLEAGKILTGSLVAVDSADNFEVDFFQAVLYFQMGDTLYLQDLKTNDLLDREYFDWKIRRAGYWLGRD